jgi:hypothetical protein
MKQPNPNSIPIVPLYYKQSGLKSAVEISISIPLRQGEFRGTGPGFLNISKISNIR